MIVDRIEPAALSRFQRLGSFGRFLTSGAFNTLATYLLYLVLLRQLHYQVSFTIAYASGIALAYAMNRYFVFRQPGGRAGPVLVATIYIGQYFLNLALVNVWVRWLSAPAALAPLFAVALTLPLTYLLNRRVFRVGSSGSAPAANRAETWRKLGAPWGRRIAMIVLIGLPILSLALNAIGWLRFGFDIPFFDDWRGYDSGEIDSFDLPYLFRAANDTMTPVGYALDAAAQRLLDGNSIAYQLISLLAVLGMLLLLQWKLLRSALGDPLQAALCFVFTLLMLQPGSYWGRENLAYQQAMPLVFILPALWLVQSSPGRWRLPVIFLLGTLSGFSYISGAVGALAAGAAVVLVALLLRARQGRAQLIRSGVVLALAGAVTSGVQVFYAVAPFKGGTHAVGKALALPTEANFWLFYLGKLGRSLLLPEDRPFRSLALVLLALAMLMVVAILILRCARSADAVADRDVRVTVMFGAIGAVVFTYLALVAAGRTNFRPVEVQSATEVFTYAFQRFHFFWATLLWPWLAAAVLVIADRWTASGWTRRAARTTGAVVVGGAVASMILLGALDHMDHHRVDASARKPTIECLMAQLQTGEGIRCDEWHMLDLTPAIIYARQIGASFVRHLPILPLELGVDSPSPWFRLSRDNDRVSAVAMIARSGRFSRAGDHAQMQIDVGHAPGMANCVMLDVRGSIKTKDPDTVKLYFRPLGQQKFNENSWAIQNIAGGPEASTFNIRAESDLGFENSLLLNPVSSRQEFELDELEVRCRLRTQEDTATGPFFSMMDTMLPATLHDIEPIGDGQGRLRAGRQPSVVFRTARPYAMASCGLLEVQAIYQVETSDVAKLFFRPIGVEDFSEKDSVSMPVAPQPEPQKFAFVAKSVSGFENQLRFDPVNHPQVLRFADIQVRCLKRISKRASAS